MVCVLELRQNLNHKSLELRGGSIQKLLSLHMSSITVLIALLGALPAEADYLLAYATIPGYVSWRNNENGSWFVSALVNVFMEMADTEHLLDMLTEVNRRVAEEFASRSGQNKQVPEPVSRLRKKLFFRPGKSS